MQALRIAIILQDPGRPPDWCMRLVEQLRAEPQFDLRALLKATDRKHRSADNRLIRIWNSVERRLAARPHPADFALYSAATADLPVLTVKDSAAIEQLGLDVILDLSGALPDRNWSARLARHGCWFLDFLVRDPGSAGMAAITSGDPVTKIALFQTSARGDVGIATASLNTKFIAARNGLFMCEKAVPLVMRQLRRTHRFGSPDLMDGVEFVRPGGLGLSDLGRYLPHLFGNISRRTLNAFMEKIGLRPGMFYLKYDGRAWPDFSPEASFAHISRRNSYFADPFLWEHEGLLFCFFEEYDYRRGRGHIRVGRFKDGELIETQVALRTDYHLSFPFLFEDSGNLYMMPETSEARRVEVWKCCEFPNRWERHATALEGTAASDSTLNFIDGTWWLFTNISNDPFLDMNTELHIFKADGPALARLEPHSVNPVILNSRQARNAGRILEINGKLYRPSQDNSHGFYGRGLSLMEIRHLSLDDYEETPVQSIAPDFEPGIIGCHHLDIRSGQVVMDVRRKIGGFAG